MLLDPSSLQIQEPLQVVTAAVTPVVMISATAILIGAVNSKHQGLSDRLRSLTAEVRHDATPEARRTNVRSQIVLFERRLRYVSIAHISLFCATACFISMVMVISFTVKLVTLVVATLPSFMAGVILLLVAVVVEIAELRLARETIALEIASTHVE